MTTSLKSVAALVCALLFLPATAAVASTPSPAASPKHCRDDNGCYTGAEGGDGGIDVQSQVTGRGDGNNGPAPGRNTWTEIQEDMSPTCYGNGRQNADALCGPAVNTCPNGMIRFWVWHQVTTYTRVNGVTTSTITRPWYQEQGTFCLGPDDPGVPTIARVITQVRSDFAHLPLVPAQVRSDPGPTTVVNIKTAFSAGTAQPQAFDPVLLGVTVHVTATPVEWQWTWGDGTTSTTTTPGVPKQPVVTHTYNRVADAPVSVVVKYSGTFSVGSDPTQYDIVTPAFSPPSAPMTVRVREARAQLVSH